MVKKNAEVKSFPKTAAHRIKIGFFGREVGRNFFFSFNDKGIRVSNF